MKKTTASTPTGLFGANAACCQRLALLAQQSQQRWLALGQRLGGAAAEYLSTLAPLKASGNWQEIAPALGEVTRSNGRPSWKPARPSPMPRSRSRPRWRPAGARP